MACSVYCLTPSSEETDRMVGRARDAGIRPEDIRVVVRGQTRHREPPAMKARWWSAPLPPAAFWWAAFYTAWPGVTRTQTREPASGPEVIALEDYRAGRGAAR